MPGKQINRPGGAGAEWLEVAGMVFDPLGDLTAAAPASAGGTSRFSVSGGSRQDAATCYTK
jgi:hypothetical protein